MVFVRKWPLGGALIAKSREDDLMAEAERLATKMEPAVAKAVAQYLNETADQLDLEAIVKALEDGDQAEVLALIAQASQKAAATAGLGVATSLQNATWAGGALASGAPTLNGVQFVFNRLNPKLIGWLSSYDLGLIRNINEQTKEAVRGVLVAHMKEGKPPAAQARQIKEVVGLTPSQAQAVANFRKELETFHTKRTAAGWKLGQAPDMVNGHNVLKPDASGAPKDGMLERRLRDRRYDAALQRALTDRKPLKPEKIDAMVAAYKRRYVAYRANMIARTESLRATNMGVQDAWRQAVEGGKVSEGLVRRLWITTKDERTCRVCSPIPSMNKGGVGLGDPFVTPDGPVDIPPLHPHCRCTIFIRHLEPGETEYTPGLPSALGRSYG